MYYNLSLDILSNLTSRSWYSWSLYSWERKTKSSIYICNTKLVEGYCLLFYLYLKFFLEILRNWTDKALYSDVMYDDKYREKIWSKDFKFICWTDVIENTRTIGYITNLFHNRRGANISRLIPEKTIPQTNWSTVTRYVYWAQMELASTWWIFGNQVFFENDPSSATSLLSSVILLDQGHLRKRGAHRTLNWKWSFCYQSSYT